MDWYLGPMRKYVVFRGRARRREWWLFFLTNVAIQAGLFLLYSVAFLASHDELPQVAAFLSYLPGLYWLATLLPHLALCVRRMHDIGYSGWWVLVPFFNLSILISNGDAGDNRFGPDPKALPTAAAESHAG